MTRAASSVLIDHLVERPGAAWQALWVVGFSLLTGLLAQVEVRLPFTPVPITGQTFGVLLSGVVLGSRRAFASQLLYLAGGAAGLPVFAGGTASVLRLIGPTGGYLWSFPVAAGLLGWLVERGAGRKTWKLALALAGASLFILGSGTLWLRNFLALSYGQAWLQGFYPFLMGDAIKITLVGAALPRVLRHYERSPDERA